MIAVIGGLGLLLTSNTATKNSTGSGNTEDSSGFTSRSLSTSNSIPEPSDRVSTLQINGTLTAASGFVLSPGVAPVHPVTGELYYDKAVNSPYVYNGSTFVSLVQPAPATAQAAAGIQSQSASTVFAAGAGLQINGTSIANTGVLSISGSTDEVIASTSTGDITLSLAQAIGTTSAPRFSGLTVSDSAEVGNELQVGGSVLLRSSRNSATAFQVQNASGDEVLDVDTSNGRVGIGTSAPSYALDVDNGDVNVGSSGTYRLDGQSINTPGTLSDVAYLDQGQTFTAATRSGPQRMPTDAFQIQDADGHNLVDADTANNSLAVTGADGTIPVPHHSGRFLQ